MSDLAVGTSARELIPGNPDDVDSLAERFSAFAEDCDQGAARLRSVDSGAWVGDAGDAFRGAIEELPEKLDRGVNDFNEAASALRSYADTLRGAQSTAARVIEDFASAQTQSAAWSSDVQSHQTAVQQAEATGAPPPPGLPPPSSDPGAALRDAADRDLAGARSEVDDAAEQAAARLKAAAEDAPDEPGFLSKAWHQTTEFVKGIGEATWELGVFVFKLTPVYQVIDPQGYYENLVGLGKGLVYGVTHPKEFGKAILDWDTWKENPARALGHLVPDLVLTLATAGGGAAAKGARGAQAASRMSRVASKADDLTALRRVAGKADEVSEIDRVGSIRRVNPRAPGEPGPGSGVPNRYENCVHCSMATDSTLAGKPMTAAPGLPMSPMVIERHFGKPFVDVASPQAIAGDLSAAGHGSRGIVLGIRGPRQIGHVFNAVNQKGVVRFLDGQTGTAADLNSGFVKFRFLRTN